MSDFPLRYYGVRDEEIAALQEARQLIEEVWHTMSNRISGDERYDEVETDGAYLYGLRRAMELIQEALGQTPEEMQREEAEKQEAHAIREQLGQVTRQRDVLREQLRQIENIMQGIRGGE